MVSKILNVLTEEGRGWPHRRSPHPLVGCVRLPLPVNKQGAAAAGEGNTNSPLLAVTFALLHGI
jgi:hypothetical protein